MKPPESVVRVFRGRPDKDGEFRGEFIGSAFFVAPDTALTARHVVRDVDRDRLFLQVGWSGVTVIRITQVILHPEEGTDVAILRIGPTLTAPPADLVRLAEVPDLAYGDRLVLYGHLDTHSPLEVRPAKVTGFEAVAGAAATDPWPTPGMSGGPATSSDLVLRGVNWARDKDGGRGYVTPLARFRDFLEKHGINMRIPACPYPGLANFSLEDAGLFFGRDAAVADLVKQVRERTFTAVVGASGSGKSSLVLAGVLPALQDDVTFAVCRIAHECDNNPFRALARALVPLVVPKKSATDEIVEIRKLTEALEHGTLDLVVDVVGAISVGEHRPFRVVIDQFEELFTLVSEDSCRRFLDLLSSAFGDSALATRAGLVITMRADFMGKALAHRGFADMLNGAIVPMGPMNEAEMLEAIKQPAAIVGVTFDDDLPERIARAAGGREGNMPLLQFTLREMWAAMTERRLTHVVYDALGGLAEALARHAERTFRDFTDAGTFSEDDFRRLFVRLVIWIDGQPPARRVVVETDIPPALRNLAQKLSEENNRLVVAGRQGDGSVSFDIVHEALAQTWPRLGGWLKADADFQDWQRRIEPLLDDWFGPGCDGETPLGGGLLARGVEFLESRSEDLSVQERAYVERSRNLESERLAREAERQASVNRAESLRLVMEADRLASREPEAALRLAWEALLQDRNELSESHFRQAVDRIKATTRELVPADQGARRLVFGWSVHGHIWGVRRNGHGTVWQSDGTVAATFRTGVVPSNDIGSVAVPDGILCVSKKGDVELVGWDGALRGKLSLAMPDDWSPSFGDAPVVASRNDGIAVVCIDARCWVIETAAGPLRPRAALDYLRSPDERPLRSVRPYYALISPFDDRFLVESSSKHVHVFDLDGNQLGRMKPPVASGFQGVLFLRDGNLAAGDMTGGGQIWADNGARMVCAYSNVANGQDLFVRRLAPSGEAFVTCHNTDGGAVTLRDSSGQPLASFVVGSERFWDADVSADGLVLAAGAGDGSINLWHWEGGRHVCSLVGHRASVESLRFHPRDPDLLLSLDYDGVLRLWHIAESPLPDMRAHDEEPERIQRNGETIVSAGRYLYPTVLWTGEANAERLNEVFVALEPSGCLVTRSADGVVLRHIDVPDCAPVRIAVPDDVLKQDFKVVTSDDVGRIALIPSSGYPVTALLYDGGGKEIARLIGEDLNPRRESDRRSVGAVLSHDGTRLGVGSRGGPIWTWNGDGAELATWMAEDYDVSDQLFQFVPGLNDGILIGGLRRSFEVWNWLGEPVTSLRLRGYKPLRIAVGRTMDRIVTISDNPGGDPRAYPELWRETGQPVPLQESFDPGYFAIVQFDPGGRYFVMQSTELRILSAEGVLLDLLIPGRNEHIVEAALSATGSHVAVLLSGGAVRLWSAAEKKWCAEISTSASRPIVFGPGDRNLLIGHASGRIERLPLSVDDLYVPARARLTRGFDSDELRRFGLTEPTKLSWLRL